MQNSDSLSSKPGAPIRVAVDAMGGDYAPQETVKGAVAALEQGDVELLLVGDAEAVEAELTKYDVAGKAVKVVPSVGKIGDDEHPMHAFRQKPEASVIVGTKLVKAGASGRAGVVGFHRGVHGYGGAGAGGDGRAGTPLHWRAIPGSGAPDDFDGLGQQRGLPADTVVELCSHGRGVCPQVPGHGESTGGVAERGFGEVQGQPAGSGELPAAGGGAT